jgi:hypothetical protein
MMSGKTPEKIKMTFNAMNDYSPEEDEEVRRNVQPTFELL